MDEEMHREQQISRQRCLHSRVARVRPVRGLGLDRDNYRAPGFLLTWNGQWGLNLKETQQLAS